MDETRHPVVREGILTGALGAGTVAAWFLVVDLLAGAPLRTPTSLGAALLGVEAPPAGAVSPLLLGAYSAFHFGAFAVVGLIAAASTRLAESRPVVLALFTVLFVTFEVGFYGIVAMLDASRLLGPLAWYQVGAGNLLAAGTMGASLLRAHPGIWSGLQHALER